jgi:hypothetical protein
MVVIALPVPISNLARVECAGLSFSELIVCWFSIALEFDVPVCRIRSADSKGHGGFVPHYCDRFQGY